MSGTPASWKPGQSGNPNGRPKKKRALTQALDASLSKTITLPDGTKINGKRYLAKLAFDAITTGEIVLANNNKIVLSPEDMLMFWKFYFSQIDGPPPQGLEHSGLDGDAIRVLIEYADDNRTNEPNTE